MEVRALTADEQTACRTKGTQKVNQLLSDLENLSEDQKFDRLHAKFNDVMKNYDSCRVNFTGEKYTPRDLQDIKRDEDELVLVKKGCVTAEVVAHGLLDAMKASPMSQVNGTSLVFRQCVERLGVEIAPDGVTFIASDIVSERALSL